MVSGLIPRLIAWVARGVAQLVGGDVTHVGLFADPVQGGDDAQRGDGPVALKEQQVRPQTGGPVVGDPVVEEFLELGVQRDVRSLWSLPTGIRSQNAEPIWTTASTVSASSSLLRIPVRASSSTISRDSGSSSAREARISMAAASSRNRGRGLSTMGRSPAKINGRCGGFG